MHRDIIYPSCPDLNASLTLSINLKAMKTNNEEIPDILQHNEGNCKRRTAIEPQRQKTYLVLLAKFHISLRICDQNLSILDSQGYNVSLHIQQMHRLIRVFDRRTCQKLRFLTFRMKYYHIAHVHLTQIRLPSAQNVQIPHILYTPFLCLPEYKHQAFGSADRSVLMAFAYTCGKVPHCLLRFISS